MNQNGNKVANINVKQILPVQLYDGNVTRWNVEMLMLVDDTVEMISPAVTVISALLTLVTLPPQWVSLCV